MSVPVLIIDDDAGVLFLHELMVRESGFSNVTSTFNRAKDALKYLQSDNTNVPTVIFLDINMPGMSGWDFLEELKSVSRDREIHVIMATSSVNRSDREKAESYSHVIGFVEKPINLETCEKYKGADELTKYFNKQ